MLNNRVLYLDLAKVVSIFFVIVNHTNSRIFLSLQPSFAWFSSLSYFNLSRIAVPIFIMATGALLLGRDEPYGKHLKRFWRAFIVLCAFSFYYYQAGDLHFISFSDLQSTIRYIIEKPTSNALWYMYLYIGIVAVMPFLQRMTSAMSRRDVEVLILLALGVAGVMSLIGHLFKISLYDRTNFTIYCYPVGFLFAGYYINKYITIDRYVFRLLLIALVLSVMMSTLFTYIEFNKGYNYSLYWSYLGSLTVSIASLSFFCVFKFLSSSNKIQLRGDLISSLSGCVFGVYLISDMVMIKTTDYYISLSEKITPFFACLIWQISIALISFAIIFLAKKIKFIRRYI
jgi:surface polysaccharide O-acyltransferase-like enzyme